MSVDLHKTLETLVAALITARHVLDKSAYWGPVRVIHRLKIGSLFHLKDPTKPADWELVVDKKPVAPGTYSHIVPEVNLREQGGNFNLILRELLHQVFQTNGEASCPWFGPSGEVEQRMERFLRRDLYEHLKR